MRYTLAIILFCVACAFSQERVIDTIYTDTHKVTYVIDTLHSNSENSTSALVSDPAPQAKQDVDTVGISAPPNKLNKISLFLIAQNLSFMLNYEHMLSDFWSVALRLGYDNFSNKNIRDYTDAEGTVRAFTMPLSLKWYWGRRNTGKYHYIDASGENHYRSKSQVESYLHAQVAPVIYKVDLHREKDDYREFLDIHKNEFAAYATFGFGGHFCYEHFVFGAEINLGTFIAKPKFIDNISVSREKYGTRLLSKYIVEHILSIGWIF